MVDLATWERLTADERREFEALLPVWQQRLEELGIGDGTELLQGWEIVVDETGWRLVRTVESSPELRGSSRAVLQALWRDAIQNLNR